MATGRLNFFQMLLSHPSVIYEIIHLPYPWTDVLPVSHSRFLFPFSSASGLSALFLCPVLGLLPLACSLSPYPRTHLHAHTLIPMCISTPSHNSHTHLYMLMHTRAYTYSFTHMYIRMHTWPHKSSFHGALALWEAWWVLVLRKSIFI